MTTAGFPIPVDGRLDQAPAADLIIVPGSDYVDDESFIDYMRTVGQECGAWLRTQSERSLLVSCCGGTFVLAEAGLLPGRKVTTTWWLRRLFQSNYPDVDLQIEELLIDEGDLITGGAAAYLDLALYLVGKTAGRFVAQDSARVLLIDANRASQAPYMVLQDQLRHSDDLVLQAQILLREQLQDTQTLKSVAEELHVSPRTLIRRFKRATGQTPSNYVQDLRLETAKRLLETTSNSVDEIVYQVGYQDESSFRRLFKRRIQMSPREYRRRFGPTGRDRHLG